MIMGRIIRMKRGGLSVGLSVRRSVGGCIRRQPPHTIRVHPWFKKHHHGSSIKFYDNAYDKGDGIK